MSRIYRESLAAASLRSLQGILSGPVSLLWLMSMRNLTTPALETDFNQVCR